MPKYVDHVKTQIAMYLGVSSKYIDSYEIHLTFDNRSIVSVRLFCENGSLIDRWRNSFLSKHAISSVTIDVRSFYPGLFLDLKINLFVGDKLSLHIFKALYKSRKLSHSSYKSLSKRSSRK